MKWFATFAADSTLAKNFVEFEAGSYDEAHAAMQHQYGFHWNHLYTEAVWNDNKIAEKNGLTKVKFGTESVESELIDPPPDETAPGRLALHVPVDCTNRYDVRILASGQRIVIGRIPIDLTREDAMVLAAWLLVHAHTLSGTLEFGAVIEVVERHYADA